jgi:hypothetical protein
MTYQFIYFSVSSFILATVIYNSIIIDSSDSMEKVKVELEKSLVNALIKLKNVGDTYSDVIRRLMEKNDKKSS